MKETLEKIRTSALEAISKINSTSKNRYWVFRKSERLDNIIKLYNDVKYKIS